MPRDAALRSALRAALRAAALAAAAGVLAAGCAAPIRVDASVDALALVGSGAAVYARMDAASAKALVPSLVPADRARALDPLLDRTRCVALALGRSAADAAAGAAGGSAGSFDAALLGDFPFRAASLALSSDPSWKREGKGFVNAGAGIRAAVPGPGLVLASSRSLEPLIAAAKAPGSSPIPERLAGLASSKIAIWAPEPFTNLVASIVGEPMDIPAIGLLVAADPEQGALDSTYYATVAFLMSDAESARIFRPALRLAWYGIARGLLGEEADSALGLSFSLDGEVYWAKGARLSAKSLAEALARIKAGLGAEGSSGR
jgi:hypothetical protein